jgi:hypothetical protein
MSSARGPRFIGPRLSRLAMIDQSMNFLQSLSRKVVSGVPDGCADAAQVLLGSHGAFLMTFVG